MSKINLKVGQVLRALGCVYYHTVSYSLSVAGGSFPNFPVRNRQSREDFLLQLTLHREG